MGNNVTEEKTQNNKLFTMNLHQDSGNLLSLESFAQ